MLATLSSEETWSRISSVIGVIYFTSWSISFYPQVILNYKRKSSTGLSQDFTLLNPLGFLAYTIYTLTFRYNHLVIDQYKARHSHNHNDVGNGNGPDNGNDQIAGPAVSLSDVAFASHALLLSLICAFQGVWYSWKARKEAEGEKLVGERTGLLSRRLVVEDEDEDGHGHGHETEGENPTNDDIENPTTITTTSTPVPPSTRNSSVKRKESSTAWTSISLSGITIGTLIVLGLVKFGRGNWKLEWLDFVYWLSYVKLYISIAKWLPQLHLNYTHRSTIGFSLLPILLDLVGSFFSFFELIIASLFVLHDPRAIWGNPVKLGLSVIGWGMDGALLGQGWWFGRRGKRNEGK